MGLIERNWDVARQGPYVLHLAMWRESESFRQPGEFTCGCRYNEAAINRGAIFGWRVPDTPIPGVSGYMISAFGNYEGEAPETPITPQQVNAITTLRSTISTDLVCVNETMSILHEMWLTETPHATGSLNDKLFEVGAFTTVGSLAAAYMDEKTQLGSYEDPDGRGWTLAMDEGAQQAPFVMFRPSNGIPVQGAIHWDDMLRRLVTEQVIGGSEYFNGIALGPEPSYSPGACRVSMAVAYA